VQPMPVIGFLSGGWADGKGVVGSSATPSIKSWPNSSMRHGRDFESGIGETAYLVCAK
jgi:hypothetical protein